MGMEGERPLSVLARERPKCVSQRHVALKSSANWACCRNADGHNRVCCFKRPIERKRKTAMAKQPVLLGMPQGIPLKEKTRTAYGHDPLMVSFQLTADFRQQPEARFKPDVSGRLLERRRVRWLGPLRCGRSAALTRFSAYRVERWTRRTGCRSKDVAAELTLRIGKVLAGCRLEGHADLARPQPHRVDVMAACSREWGALLETM